MHDHDQLRKYHVTGRAAGVVFCLDLFWEITLIFRFEMQECIMFDLQFANVKFVGFDFVWQNKYYYSILQQSKWVAVASMIDKNNNNVRQAILWYYITC